MTDTPANLLLIDDDPDMDEAVETMLSPDGYRITCCRTASEGLEKMRHARPDLVLLDIMLTRPTEGLEVACQMRQDAHLRDIPIIFLSAMGQSAGDEYAKVVCPIPIDADMYLEKPLDAATVRDAVRWVLEQKAGR